MNIEQNKIYTGYEGLPILISCREMYYEGTNRSEKANQIAIALKEQFGEDYPFQSNDIRSMACKESSSFIAVLNDDTIGIKAEIDLCNESGSSEEFEAENLPETAKEFQTFLASKLDSLQAKYPKTVFYIGLGEVNLCNGLTFESFTPFEYNHELGFEKNDYEISDVVEDMYSLTSEFFKASYHDLYRMGDHHIGYQPDEDVFPDNMHSWEVYGSLDNGLKAHPSIPPEKWIQFDFSGDKEPIEDVEFLD